MLVAEIVNGLPVSENIGTKSSQLSIQTEVPPKFKPRHILSSVPEKNWPVWVKALRQFSQPKDAGIGDVVARIIGDENSLAFNAWHLKTFGKPCNCPARRNRWNKLYPLK